KNMVLKQWQALLPKSMHLVQSGRSDINLWIDFKKGALSSVQSELFIKDLTWQLDKKKQSIPQVSANVAWEVTKNGWQLTGDHIALNLDKTKWPVNKIAIQFDSDQQSYQLYVKTILLDSLKQLNIAWPEQIKSILSYEPHGTLDEVQLKLKDHQCLALLMRFANLGWTGKKTIPQVNNLTGALNWQPEEGRLELDSEQTQIKVAGFPSQTLELLNAAVDWKELNNGLRISVERFALTKPDLTLTLEGAVDQVTPKSLGHIRLDAALTGKNLEQWIALIPDKLLKPKLDLWLKKDIKRIGEGTAKLSINGMAQDFPFDNNNGTFNISAHVDDVDLHITSKWKVITDVEAYLRFNNRDLDVDIVKSNVNGIPMNKANIRIDAIGKNRETLLFKTETEASVKKLIDFVLASPLQNKLSTLKLLNVKGSTLLKLDVEAPLYPENDDILVKGDLTFKNNTVILNHHVGSISLEDVAGGLSFDEKGIKQSALTATAYGYPLDIKMQSVKLPHPYTTILVDGECTMESLKNRFASPIFAYLKGLFAFNATFKLTEDPNDLDSLNVKTSLEGLAINLPAPLGKTHKMQMPLDVNVEFNPKKAIRFKANYNNKLSADIYFDEDKGAFVLQSGEVKLGAAHALDQKKPGLGVVGSLDGFDLPEWKKVFSQLSEGQSNSALLKKLRIIDVKLGKVNLWDQQFDDLTVKAKILPNNDWSLVLEQKNIDANLTYNLPNNLFSGYVKRLKLAKLDVAKTNQSKTKLHPQQIPNLNLRIDNLTIGEMQIGNMTLKTKSTAERLHIDYCQIISPLYQMNMEGQWSQIQNKNRTQVHVRMLLKDLGKNLELWGISPAVDADKGEMEFKGGWNDSMVNFSLSTLNGAMYLKLKNGLISHLSPETEEKLGLGKLLSILSLQTIPRRLQLDFSDLANQGYSFDVFKGNFTIKNGVMNTQDSYLEGPVAYASMKGDLDLVSRVYDLDLSISPHITASLPVVATIAGGPIAGIAAWIANKIISKGMQKIISYTYKISGPWDQPVVQQLKIVKKKMKKKT
ncbi:MAG: TIGR02099 family protein, partial [Legionella sp.]